VSFRILLRHDTSIAHHAQPDESGAPLSIAPAALTKPGVTITLRAVSHKSPKIAALIAHCQGQTLDAHYLGYFECFNRQLFYEAHDVLEELWLKERKGPRDLFFKGLIQLAGAFVHLQKDRLRPAEALFKLARHNLSQYPAAYESLDVQSALEIIALWMHRLEEGNYTQNPLSGYPQPNLSPNLKKLLIQEQTE
jgi:predicted metal-dependent hydrolase